MKKSKRVAKKFHASRQNGSQLFVLAAFMITFAGIGAWWFFFRSSAAPPRSIAGFGGYNCNSTPVLTAGNTGDCVRALQYGLNNWNTHYKIGLAPVSADGNFSDKTITAVKAFQKRNGLPDTGTVDQATWNAFLLDCAPFKACISI